MKDVKEEIELVIGFLPAGQDKTEFKEFIEFFDSVPMHNIMEIGTDRGGMFLMMLKHSSGIKISLDIPYGMYGTTDFDLDYRNRMFRLIDSDAVIIEGDSHEEASRKRVEDALHGELLDLLFIDGDHSYEGVLRDLTMYNKYVKLGGYICLHDIKPSPHHIDMGCMVHELWDKITCEKKEIKNLSERDFGIGIVKKTNELIELIDKINGVTSPMTVTHIPKGSKKKYICASMQSTSQCKYWNYPNGWMLLTEEFRKKGYEVYFIDQHAVFGREIMNSIPANGVDKTGLPLEELTKLIRGCDFFIGISSGLSWLAWALGKEVVMISGFTDPSFEFKCHRVNNPSVCNNCMKDGFDISDWMYCPKQKDTDRQFECTKTITPEMVLSKCPINK